MSGDRVGGDAMRCCEQGVWLKSPPGFITFGFRVGFPIWVLVPTLFLLCLSLTPRSAFADEPSSRWLVFGVFAYLGEEKTRAQYQPLVDYLNSQLTDVSVALEVLPLEDIEQRIAQREIDIVATNPTHFLIIRQRYPLSGVIATVAQNVNGQPLAHLGGVMITQGDRSDINTIRDIRGKVVAVPSLQHMGGFRAQAFELHQHGLRLPEAVREIRVADGHHGVVREIVARRADVGFVRTGILEQMLEQKALLPGDVKVLNPQRFASFPHELSTRLYPEWPVFALPHVHENLVRNFATALFSLNPDHPAALAAGIHGFTVPADYLVVEELARTLRLPPFDQAPEFSLADIWQQYRDALAVLALIGLFALLLLLGFALMNNRKLRDQRTQLTASEARLGAVLGALGEGVFGCDRDGRISFANTAAATMLGCREQELLGREHLTLTYTSGTPSETQPASSDPITLTNQDCQARTLESCFWRKDGSRFPVNLVVTPWFQSGEHIGTVVVFADISARRHAEQELRKLSQAIAQNPETILITDREGRIEYVNDVCLRRTGFQADELLGQKPSIFRSARTPPETFDAMWDTLNQGEIWRGELTNRRKDSSEIVELVTLAPLRDSAGNISHFLGIQQDISALKAAEEQVHRLANYDPLTGLPNRNRLLSQLRSLLDSAVTVPNSRYVLIFINIDRFKIHNHAGGQGFGDKLLRAVADRLRSSIDELDLLARLGADEFAILVSPAFTRRETASRGAFVLAENFHELLREPFMLDGELTSVTASLGITLFPEAEHGDNDSVHSILRRAGTALQRAKKAGGNQTAFFDAQIGEQQQHNFQIEHDLHRAIEKDELRLFLQPQVNQNGDLVSYEALIRWEHPKRGLLAPGAFINIAEESDLIVDIGAWVFQKVCHLIAKEHIKGRNLSVSVNLSPRHFRRDNFVEWVSSQLTATGINPCTLTLEVTENLMIDDADTTIAKMTALRKFGLRFSIDDFGTGFSSLSYLKRLPVQELKIDQSFVREAPDDPETAALVDTIISVAQTMNLQIVAEGVEEHAHLYFLAQRPEMLYQGYYFGRPAPAEHWLEGKQTLGGPTVLMAASPMLDSVAQKAAVTKH